MEDTMHFATGAGLLGFALLVGMLGLSFLSLPRGGENEISRAIGTGILFLCAAAILGLTLMHYHSFTNVRESLVPVTGSRP